MVMVMLSVSRGMSAMAPITDGRSLMSVAFTRAGPTSSSVRRGTEMMRVHSVIRRCSVARSVR